jgi:hypothetical protein
LAHAQEFGLKIVIFLRKIMLFYRSVPGSRLGRARVGSLREVFVTLQIPIRIRKGAKGMCPGVEYTLK